MDIPRKHGSTERVSVDRTVEASIEADGQPVEASLEEDRRQIEVSLPRIEAALQIVDREVQYVTAERDAFEALRKRLNDLEVAAPAESVPSGSPAAVALVGGGSPDRGIRATVLKDVRATVMDVPHFEAEYGDTVAETLVAEFGAALAAALLGDGPVTPTHLEALRTGTDRAVDERRTLLRVLRRERSSLTDVREALTECERDAVAVGRAVEDADPERRRRYADRLGAIADRCDALADARQRRLHNRAKLAISGVGETSLTAFLYGDLEHTCPALASIATCLRTVQHHRARCRRDEPE
jgi:DNA-binding transcriptional MerR regulator